MLSCHKKHSVRPGKEDFQSWSCRSDDFLLWQSKVGIPTFGHEITDFCTSVIALVLPT